MAVQRLQHRTACRQAGDTRGGDPTGSGRDKLSQGGCLTQRPTAPPPLHAPPPTPPQIPLSHLLAHHGLEALRREGAVRLAQGPVPRQRVEVGRRQVDPRPEVLPAGRAVRLDSTGSIRLLRELLPRKR
jgi:hypothetical protein